jgi:hypothetical protein
MDPALNTRALDILSQEPSRDNLYLVRHKNGTFSPQEIGYKSHNENYAIAKMLFYMCKILESIIENKQLDMLDFAFGFSPNPNHREKFQNLLKNKLDEPTIPSFGFRPIPTIPSKSDQLINYQNQLAEILKIIETRSNVNTSLYTTTTIIEPIIEKFNKGVPPNFSIG